MPIWKSSSKPPLRNNRPTTAPEKRKKQIEIIESESDRESNIELEIVPVKVPIDKTKSLPNLIPNSILKNTSIGLSRNVKSKPKIQEQLSIQFVESIPLGRESVDLLDSVSLSHSLERPMSSKSNSESIQSQPQYQPLASTPTGDHMVKYNTMDTLRTNPSEKSIDGELITEDGLANVPELDLKEFQEPEIPKVVKKVKPVKLIEKRPPWGTRKATAISFDPFKTKPLDSIPTAEKPKKPFVPRFGKRRYKRNDSTDSDSEPDVNEDAIEPSTEGVPPEPTEPTEPVEKVESADTSSVKTSQEQISELEKKAIGNPLTKLRFSQYNLFSTTAGPFRGPGDPYYKFVLGGRSIRQGAKLLQKYKTAEVDQGKFDELLIDKSLNRYSTPAYNHKTLFKMRDKKKQSIELAIHSKVDNLEKMRAYIITTMHSLQSHKALLHDLMNQHDILKEQYQETLRDINERVSTTLATNEESMIQIKTLEHDKAIERKRLVKEFARLMRHWEEEERLVEEHRNCLQKAYDEKTRDLEDLMEFERASFEDPEVTTKRLYYELEQKDKHIKDMEIHLKSYDEQFVIQEKSIETAAFERGLEIIKKSMTKFSKYVDRVILKASQDTLRLRKEIEKQETIRVQIEQDIINEEVKNKTLKESLKQQKDPRRNVLKMKEYMTCTPDMDIVLESSTASTNPAVTVQ